MRLEYKTLEEATRHWAKVTLKELGKVLAKWLTLKMIGAVGGGVSAAGGGGGSGTTSNVMITDPNLAKGGVIHKGVQTFAKGGVINQPTLFPMAKGAGLAGEAGPEGIFPLARGKSGKLGVEAVGGIGGGQTIVNNYYNINAMDSQSFMSFAQRNKETFLMPLNDSVNKGETGTLNTLRNAVA